MKSWFCSNFSVQVALDWILEYLNFQNFPGEHVLSIASILHVHIFPVPPPLPHRPQGKIPGATVAFSALVSPAEKRAPAIPSWETTSATSVVFNQS